MDSWATQVLEQFDRALKSKRRSAHTRRSYRGDLEGFLAGLSPEVVFPQGVKPSDVEAFIARATTPLTSRRRLSALRTFFRWAHRKKLTDRNVASEIEHVETGRIERDVLTEEQIEEFLARVRAGGSSRDLAMVLVLVETGLQASELVSVRVTELGLGESATALRIAGRGRRCRELRVGAAATEALRRWLKEGHSGSDYVFPNYRGQRLTPRSLDRILRQYEPPSIAVTPRILRNTLASRRLKGGSELVDVRRLLGHAEPSVTELHARAKPRQRIRLHPPGRS